MSFTIALPTRDIPVEEENLSPALAALAAQLSIPYQYRTIIGAAVLSMNEHCPVSASNAIER